MLSNSELTALPGAHRVVKCRPIPVTLIPWGWASSPIETAYALRDQVGIAVTV